MMQRSVRRQRRRSSRKRAPESCVLKRGKRVGSLLVGAGTDVHPPHYAPHTFPTNTTSTGRPSMGRQGFCGALFCCLSLSLFPCTVGTGTPTSWFVQRAGITPALALFLLLPCLDPSIQTPVNPPNFAGTYSLPFLALFLGLLSGESGSHGPLSNYRLRHAFLSMPVPPDTGRRIQDSCAGGGGCSASGFAGTQWCPSGRASVEFSL